MFKADGNRGQITTFNYCPAASARTTHVVKIVCVLNRQKNEIDTRLANEAKGACPIEHAPFASLALITVKNFGKLTHLFFRNSPFVKPP